MAIATGLNPQSMPSSGFRSSKPLKLEILVAVASAFGKLDSLSFALGHVLAEAS